MISAKDARNLHVDRPTRIKRATDKLLEQIDQAVRNSAEDFDGAMYVGVRTDMFDYEVIASVTQTLEDLGYTVEYHEMTEKLKISWD